MFVDYVTLELRILHDLAWRTILTLLTDHELRAEHQVE